MSKKTEVQSALVLNGYELETYLEFERHMASGNERVGQAFFHALDPSDQEVLSGTRFDPFYSDEVHDVLLAIAWLKGEL